MTVRATALLATALLLAAPAFGDPVAYELRTPGVVCHGSSARARAAVSNMDNVGSVKTDSQSHTVTVEFDDGKVSLDAIVSALGKSGYRVAGHRKLD